MIWVTWNSLAHAAKVDRRDVRVGSFPLMCGRWAPDGWDADVHIASGERRCKRCAKVAEVSLVDSPVSGGA